MDKPEEMIKVSYKVPEGVRKELDGLFKRWIKGLGEGWKFDGSGFDLEKKIRDLYFYKKDAEKE